MIPSSRPKLSWKFQPPQDFLSILHQVCDKVIKVSVFNCFLATAVTIKKKNNNNNKLFLAHENYVPLIDSTQLMIIAQTFKISVAHSGISRFCKVKLSFSLGIKGEEGGLER